MKLAVEFPSFSYREGSAGTRSMDAMIDVLGRAFAAIRRGAGGRARARAVRSERRQG